MSDVGEGWRLLKVGELVEAGDEYETPGGTWRPSAPEWTGYPTGRACSRFRRRVPAATADAPTPKPEPLAWGVQFIETGFLLGHYTERYEAEAVCRATNSGESECPYGPVSVVPLYSAPPSPHPWCQDVARDLAVRVGETHDDTILHRDLPDAIHRLNGLVAGLAERMAELERQNQQDEK